MGLTARLALGLAAALTLAAAFEGCVKEVPLTGPDVVRPYLFVDGGLELGESTHTLVLGRTRGAGIESFTPIEDAAVEVEEVATGKRQRFSSGFRGRYLLRDYPVDGRAYRLHIATADGRAFSSRPDSLRGRSPSVDARAILLKRLYPTGDSGVVGAGVRLNFSLPPQGSEGLLLIDHTTAFRVSDLICGFADNATSCYVLDTPVVNRFQFLDIASFEPGTIVRRDVANVPFDWRMGEVVVVATNVSRYSAAATDYFNTIAGALRTGDGFFAAKPLTPAGNITEVGSGSAGETPVLGYFGVRERNSYYVPLTTPEIRALAGPPACSGGAAGVPAEVDCCYCDTWERAKLEKPIWFP